MIPWLKSFYEELPGVGSMVRLIHWWAFVFCIVVPVLVWSAISLRSGSLAAIDSTISTFALGGFATATAGKVIQSVKSE